VVETEEFDFVLFPIQMSDRIVGQEFDIAVNTSSFQEMADSTVEYWMDFIEHRVRVKGFYSCNYFLKLQYPETSGAESNLMCPVLDPFWKVKYFRINPEIVTVDANTRNWLELCVERIPTAEQSTGTLEEVAFKLFEKGKRQPKGNNDWFESLWMAIWYFPSKELIHEMLEGIQLFKQGLGTKNLLWDQHFLFGPGDMSRTTSMWVLGLRRRSPRLWNVLRINKAFAKLCLRSMVDLNRGRRLDAPNEYREEIFYKKMMANLE
jgi:hypothetical protein